MYMCIYIYTVCMQVSIAEKLQNLRSHRACGRLATAVGMLGHVTMSDPGQTTDVMWFPDVPRRFSQQNFPRRLYAGLQSLEHLPHAPFNIFQYVQRQRSQKSHSLNFGTQFLQVQQCQLRNDAKLIQVAPFTPSAINALITALGTAWCDLPNLPEDPEVFSGASGGWKLEIGSGTRWTEIHMVFIGQGPKD